MSSVDEALRETTRAQHRASDPGQSSWVSANAGAGKTHVLKLRVLRLLLTNVAPARILCLTYTKAAAAEMATRVFDELAEWAVMPDGELAIALKRTTGAPPADTDLEVARQLFARAIETPGGLKIQTIHAFAERLLQRFPLEAGVPPGFEIIDEGDRAALIDAAIDKVLLDAAGRAHGSQARRDLEAIIAFADEARFQEVLGRAFEDRQWIAFADDLEAAAKARGDADGDAGSVVDLYYRTRFGLTENATEAEISAEIARLLDDATCSRAIDALTGSGKSTDAKMAMALRTVRASEADNARAKAICAALLTNEQKPRKSLMTKAVRDAYPDLATRLEAAGDRAAKLIQQRNAVRTVAATRALLSVTRQVARAFETAKLDAGVLDFDDLISKTERLLKETSSARWVLYKLDGGLDHILVDEAQDTSDRQWRIIEALAAAFFDTDANAADRHRTVFAVGDEKQSIYSFQGAAPDKFADAGQRFEDAASAAGQSFARVPLTLSFRTVPPVLAAVDRVFGATDKTPGVTGADGAVQHAAMRSHDAGRVDVWPLEERPEVETTKAFDPLGDAMEVSATASLSERIAAEIMAWIASGRTLASTGAPIRPRDILILVRKRQPLAGPIMSALKRVGLPVAGADRIVLSDQLAVQDLIALGEFLVLPEDDLALANALKSPLFDFDDEDLMALAPGRAGSLWHALVNAEAGPQHWELAAAALRRLRGLADYMPPYEFFAKLLAQPSLPDPVMSVRQRFLRRLGPDAADPLDEFLQRALTFDDAATPSMQGFLQALKSSDDELRRDMDQGRDEIRLMTVHGAKGLEAPVVLLPDTTRNPARANQSSIVPLSPANDEDTEAPVPLSIWAIPPAKTLDVTKAGRDAVSKQEREEADRLLYVAMTRAQDELHVCGIAPANEKARDGTWYDLIDSALEPLAVDVTSATGLPIRRYANTSDASVPRLEAAPAGETVAPPQHEPPPAWIKTRPPDETPRVIPLAPSKLAPLETDTFGDPVSDAKPEPAEAAVRTAPSPGPRELADNRRFLRGTLTHALLQHLPTVAPDRWADAARTFVDIQGRELSEAVRASIVDETLAVLRTATFADVFGPGSRAEVQIVAEIASPMQGRQPLQINGHIDRLCVHDHDVLIVDFKTNRPPPLTVDIVPDAYLLQLAAYRLAVRNIWPNHDVQAALLWTDGPRLMIINDDRLTAAEQRLWTPAPPALDLGGVHS